MYRWRHTLLSSAFTPPAGPSAAENSAERSPRPTMPADEDEEHVDAEMADATDGLAVSAKKKKNKKKKKGGGGGDADADGAEEAGTEEAGTASAAAGDGAEGAEADGADGEGGGEMSAAKKKREKKKASDARKKAAAAEGGGEGGAADEIVDDTPWSSEIRGIKPWGAYPKCEKGGKQQTNACTVPVLQQFPSGCMPVGEEVAYIYDANPHPHPHPNLNPNPHPHPNPDPRQVAYIYDANSARARIKPEELRERERLHSISYDEVRTAAECHRQVRKHMQSVIRPGILMEDMCNQLGTRHAGLEPSLVACSPDDETHNPRFLF